MRVQQERTSETECAVESVLAWKGNRGPVQGRVSKNSSLGFLPRRTAEELEVGAFPEPLGRFMPPPW